MIKQTLSVIIWSENPDKLADWYKNTFDLSPGESTTLPDDYCIGFDFGSNYFSIGKHDNVTGKNKDPYRIMIGFNVDSVTEMYNKIKDKTVILAPPFLAPPGGFYCMTVEDPEKNIIQFFGPK
jgi:predicted enzyme related to lactoylglutathione lyase